ncbi:MAG: PorT family protein [Bacteroidetes Order II. Incertae sedis bacterium]|nr:PorT family protein [Bacteroidetes Order II. bacterium]
MRLRLLPSLFRINLLIGLGLFQTATAQEYGIGARIGLTQTRFWNDPDTEFSATTRQMVGLILYHQSNDRLGFQAEALYSPKGAQLYDPTLFPDVNLFRFDMVYLDVPVMAVVDLLPDAKVAPQIHFGPQISFLMDARTKAGVKGQAGWLEDNADESVRSIDIGTVAGVGARFRRGSHMWMLDARYSLGVLDLVKNDSNPKRNQAFSVLVGIMF